jgi:hypothetical protein
MKTKEILVKSGMSLKINELAQFGAEGEGNRLLRHPEGDAWPDTGPTTTRR